MSLTLAEASVAQSRPRRVLIATDTYPPDVNGAAYFTHRLASGLAARSRRCTSCAPPTTRPPVTDVLDGVLVHRLRSARLMVHPTMRFTVPAGLGRTMDRLVRRIEPDVVHTQGHFVVGRSAVAAAKRAGLPVVATNHFMPDNLFQFTGVPNRLRRRVGELAWKDLNRIFERADHVTTPTPLAAGLLSAKGLRSAVEAGVVRHRPVRFHPQPQAWARRRFGVPERPTILFVGRLDEEKHLEEIVLALPKLLNDIDCQAVFVGQGNRREYLEKLAHRVGAGDNVRFLGFVADADLPQAYAVADVFCMPGTAELQSIATLEAMASGLPVVAADAMALPHLIEGNGHLYTHGDVSELARHLKFILTHDEERAAMAKASLALAATHTHERSLARFEAIYGEVLHRAPISAVH